MPTTETHAMTACSLQETRLYVAICSCGFQTRPLTHRIAVNAWRSHQRGKMAREQTRRITQRQA